MTTERALKALYEIRKLAGQADFPGSGRIYDLSEHAIEELTKPCECRGSGTIYVMRRVYGMLRRRSVPCPNCVSGRVPIGENDGD